VTSELLRLADEAVGKALSAGATEAEAYVADERSLTVRMRSDEVQWLRSSRTQGVGVRALAGGRTGYAYASQPDASALTDLAEQAVAGARVAALDAHAGLPDPGPEPPVVGGLTAESTGGTQERVAVLRALAAAARDYDPAVRRILRNHYGEDFQAMAVANSRGVRAAYETSIAYAWVELLATSASGDHTGNSFGWGRSITDLDPVRIGREAAEQAVGMVGAAPVRSQTVPIVLTPGAMSNVLGRLARMLSAEAVQRGRSLFRDLLGAGVAAPVVTLTDDATLHGGLASRPVDAEGVASRPVRLISSGRLEGLLHSSTTARIAGTEPTGNARRSSYRALPAPGASNLFLEAGPHGVGELRRKAWWGLEVTELMGLHATNPITGAFSASVRGRWISGGELAQPVVEVTISGEYLSLLADVEALADDLRFYPGGVVAGSPSVLVPDVTVSGL
jgi:PmbA protein